MRERMIDSKRIRLGRVTYFDKEHNGTVVPSVDAYVFLVNVNGVYVNPFNVADELPVYDRVPYSNTTRDGHDYGTKIVLANGEVKEGPCYVMEKIDVGEYYGKKKMSLDMLEECILSSEKFFIDRIGILEKMGGSPRRKYYNHRKLIRDLDQLNRFNEFMDSCMEDSMQYHK
jgi:hypothetical protein